MDCFLYIYLQDDEKLTMNTPETMETRFDKKFMYGFCGNCNNSDCKNHTSKALKDFNRSEITLAVKEREREIVEKVKKLKSPKFDSETLRSDCYGQAKQDIISLIQSHE